MDVQQAVNWTEPAIAHALQVATIWKVPITGIICITSPVPIIIFSFLLFPRDLHLGAELAAGLIWGVWTFSWNFADALIHEGDRLPMPGLGLHATLIPQILPNSCAEATLVEGPECYPCARDELKEWWEHATAEKIAVGIIFAMVVVLAIYIGYIRPYFYPAERSAEEAEDSADLEKGVSVCR